MKVRKVVTRSGRGFRAYVPSYKLKRMVEAESVLESDVIPIFEFSRGVVSFQEQPELILYELEGKVKRYYPDFEVLLRSGEIIHFEVKPQSQLKSPELLKKLTAIRHHYESMGRDFRLITDDHVRKQPLLGNLKHLRRYQFVDRRFDWFRSQVINTLGNTYVYSIKSLGKMYGLENIVALISRGEIVCDLNKTFLDESNLVRLPTGEDDDSLLF